MAKAIRVHETGGPDVLKFEEVDIAAPGRGEVIIQQRAVGLNFIDVYYRKGLYPAPLPFIPGGEGAGEVLAVGKGVKEFKAGDRVAYTGGLGGYAAERMIPAQQLVKLPKHISFETAAAMMLKGLTAQYLLHSTFKVKKGHVILVHAAAGGVGLILCQWARALGATIIATVGSPGKAEVARRAGAKHVILYSEENFAERVKEITKGELCDVVYDGVGKATFPASLDCLHPRGMFVSFGASSGQIDAFNIGLLQHKGSLFATRPTLAHYIAERSELEDMAHDLFKAVEKGDIEIPIHASYALADAAKAHRALEARSTTGATVLIP